MYVARRGGTIAPARPDSVTFASSYANATSASETNSDSTSDAVTVAEPGLVFSIQLQRLFSE